MFYIMFILCMFIVYKIVTYIVYLLLTMMLYSIIVSCSIKLINLGYIVYEMDYNDYFCCFSYDNGY